MMQCPHCSAQIAPNASFCSNCGQKIARQEEPELSFTKTHLKQVSILIVLSALIVGSVGFFFFENKSSRLNAIKNSKELLLDTADKTGKVNNSLEAIYNYVTSQNNNSTESSAWPTFGIRLTSANSLVPKPALNLYFLNSEINDAVAALKNKNVKAFSTSNTDPLKAYRDLKDLSAEAQRESGSAVDSAQALANFKDSPDSASLKKNQTDISKISDETNGYLNEAVKTANYYETYSDVYISLATTIISALDATNSQQLSQSLLDAKKIETQMDSLKSTDLPMGIDGFHKDILTEINSAIDFLTVFNAAATSNDPGAANQASQAATNWVSEEKALLVKIQTDQTNFWKNNTILSGYDFLSKAQNDLVSKLDGEQKSEQFFIIK